MMIIVIQFHFQDLLLHRIVVRCAWQKYPTGYIKMSPCFQKTLE